MIRGHGRYEALAGAIALGEADDGERAAFGAHAATCAVCRADAAAGTVVAAALAGARDRERWRPSLRDAVIARIGAARGSCFRTTVGVLAWAAGASLVVNLAVAGGLSKRLDVAPAADRAAAVATTTIELEAPRPLAIPTAPPLRVLRSEPAPAAAVARAPRPSRAESVTRAARPALDLRPVRRRPAAASLPDVLAGLDLDDPAGRRVALELRFPCARPPEALDAPPCPARAREP